jgi:hypothetical protein
MTFWVTQELKGSSSCLFQALSQHTPQGSDKTTANLILDGFCPERICTSTPPEQMPENVPLVPNFFDAFIFNK